MVEVAGIEPVSPQGERFYFVTNYPHLGPGGYFLYLYSFFVLQ